MIKFEVTRLKNNCDLIVPLIHTNFGNRSSIITGVFLFCKYDIHLANFDKFNYYKKIY